jgi:Spy/CpxP family protein refolding chaperone
MNKNRFAKPVAIAAGLIFLWAAPGLTRAQSASPRPVPTSKVASPGAQANRDSLPPDDFAGLSYTDEQKAEIEKIRLDTTSRKAVVAKDEKLTADQKDAMLLGYTRMEYGRIYKVLSPEQQRQVRQRISARRAAHQAAKKKQPSQPNK